jgi:coenzyme Q-binding protein COQ10
MPTVQVREVIPRNINDTWNMICDFEKYPNLMEPVRNLRILDKKGNTLISEWEVNLKGSILKWTESDTKLPEKYRIEFTQMDGDLEQFNGYWQLSEMADTQTEVFLYTNFEIGIPMLRDMLDPVAKLAIEENSQTMLRAFGEQR